MSNRSVRVNELVQREISDVLHRRYQQESVALTITEVRVSPDLRDARVFISFLGGDEAAQEKLRWVKKIAPEIRAEVGRRITLKYLPKFEYFLDKSTARGTRLLGMLDDLDRKEKA